MGDWRRKDVWSKRETGFCIEVSRHEDKPLEETEGPHRWCVYAYIYPNHTLFDKFDGDSLWQEATDMLPLHYGCSLLKRHTDEDGNVCSIQVGADYNHLGDEQYTHMETDADARVIFSDADGLLERLKEMEAERDLP